DSRVQALAGALCVTVCAVTGITNRSLRALMTGLLGAPYTMAQASYDLARLARNGLITRRPHANTYDLTLDGLAFAVFYIKVHRPVVPRRPPTAPAPPPSRPAANRTPYRRPSRPPPPPGASPTNSAQLSKPPTHRTARQPPHRHRRDLYGLLARKLPRRDEND